jgi:hypothetical protein
MSNGAHNSSRAKDDDVDNDEETLDAVTSLTGARRRGSATAAVAPDDMSVSTLASTVSMLTTSTAQTLQTTITSATSVRPFSFEEMQGISKFDVLLCTNDNHHGALPEPLYEFFTVPSSSFHHVGNNRCQVVCQMHRAEYARATTLEQQDTVLDRVYSMVLSLQCVDVATPRLGKFLVRQSSNGAPLASMQKEQTTAQPFAPYWLELPKDRARRVLRNLLSDAPAAQGEELLPHLRRSMNDVATAVSPRVAMPPLRHSMNDAVLGNVTPPIPRSLAVPSAAAQQQQHPSARQPRVSLAAHLETASPPTAPKGIASAGASATAELESDTASVTSAQASVSLMDDEKKRRRRSSLLRRSVSMTGDVFGDEKKRVARANSILLQLQAFDVSCSTDEDDEEDQIVEVAKTETEEKDKKASDELGGKFDAEKPNDAANDTASGRRRGSHLGASMPMIASSPLSPIRVKFSKRASMVASMPSDMSPARSLLVRSPSWSQGLDSARHEILANALDVIFRQSPLLDAESDQTSNQATRYILTADHTGNNRLLVMVQLRLSRYMAVTRSSQGTDQKAPSAAAERVGQTCRELVEAVQVGYKGRFLVEDIQIESGDTVSYRLLTDDQAAAALECVFQAEAAVEEALTAPVPSSSTTVASVNDDTMSVASGSLASVASSVITLPNIPTTFNSSGPGRATSGDVHRAAIESLQKRKKRQGVSNKISQMVAMATGNSTLRERSRSAGEVLGGHGSTSSQSFIPMEQLSGMPPPPVSGNLSRFGSTGISIPLMNRYASLDRTVEETAFLQQDLQHQAQLYPLNENPASFDYRQSSPTVTWDSSIPPPRNQQTHLYHSFQGTTQYQQQQQQQQMGVPRRRSTLSEFSQGMIHDMLQRLEANNDFSMNDDSLGHSSGMGAPMPGMYQQQTLAQGPSQPGWYAGNDLGSDTFTQPQYPNHTHPTDGGGDAAFPVSADAAAAALALGFGSHGYPPQG